ncbi:MULTISPECIES: gluconokinase [Vibrio]|uniref:Gluconokinase n=2 Tax=Vibrio TaxID=662 RepID=A0A7X4RT53_9VIBR|nr:MULTISPECIES: gluconokinase [Vibrio]MBF9001995.1 gluconokinase [Vibrio nitrifigilis]MZI92451.1 gluconate kinase [Vibrio eleionomae]
MGVSSCGKSSIGAAVARQLEAKFIDGDDLHPKANILKMKSGHPLNDDDRAPWLERINDAVFSIEMKHEEGIIVCSALRQKYRDQIRQGNSKLTFIHLYGDFELVKGRMLAREDHFMPIELLKSQFETLEKPTIEETDVIEVSIDGSFDDVVARCVTAIKQHQTA